jgi:rubrerythrin
MAETVKDIIERIRSLHNQLGWFYQTMGDAAEKERVRMLLQYLSRHERNLEQALGKYEEAASRAVLGTWFKNTPENPLQRQLDSISITADMTSDEVVRIVLALDRCLVDTFKRIADSAVAEDVKQLFHDLVAMEESEEHKLMRDALELEDV